jgi:iron complex transport system ATP-binding protein
MLTTRALCAGYHGKTVAGPLDLDIARNTLTGIKARNGAGKTTLLKTLAGIIPPVAGQVMIAGQDMQRLSIEERAQLVSIVFTDRIRLNGITVRQLVNMSANPEKGLFSFLQKDDDHRGEQAMTSMGILDLSAKPLSRLSDGELQKAMISRALAQGCRLMLMDEPTAFLDYVAREELFVMLKKLVRDEGMTVIFSSHDIELMTRYADNILTI